MFPRKSNQSIRFHSLRIIYMSSYGFYGPKSKSKQQSHKQSRVVMLRWTQEQSDFWLIKHEVLKKNIEVVSKKVCLKVFKLSVIIIYFTS